MAFDLIGPFLEGESSKAVQARAKDMSNLTLHGGMPRERLHQFYNRASLLCCTSEYEGFPKHVSRGLEPRAPIVSTFDPDGVIAKHNLGIVARDAGELQAAIRSLLASPRALPGDFAQCAPYFLQNHEANSVLPRFEALFLETLQGKKKN